MAQKLISNDSLTFVAVVLHLLAHDHPVLQGDLDALLLRWHRRFGLRTILQDEQAIVRAVRDGYATARDLSEKTSIPYVTVTKRLKELVTAGVLTTSHAPYAEGHGGDRCTVLYWLAPKWREAFRQKHPATGRPVQLGLF